MFARQPRIYVAGHRGLVGQALLRRLNAEGCQHLLLKTHAQLDLTVGSAVDAFFECERPEFVFLAAAKVGGILANDSRPGEFIRDNLLIQTHVIDACHRFGVKKLLFLGSSCIYPKFASQPIAESALLTGPLEPTNQAYAVAKIAGIAMCQAYHRQYGSPFISAMPTNLYGPHDNFDPQGSHVLPALMRRFHEAKVQGAKQVTIWGTGTPRREFLHCDDLAEACLYLMDHYQDSEPINVGTGRDCTIAELAAMVAQVVGFVGQIAFDASKPDGTPKKQLNVSRLAALGWQPKISLQQGLAATYGWCLENAAF